MPSRMFALSLFVSLGFASGCMTPQTSDPDAPPKSTLLTGNSSAGAATSEDEAWSKMGRQMRGDAPAQQTFDPLRDVMSSPKAQSIERSLGVD